MNALTYYPHSIFDELDSFFSPNLKDTKIRLNRTTYTSKIVNDELQVALSVTGHDPKKVTLDCTDDKITVKAVKDKEDESIESRLIADIEETFRLGKEYDGLTAKAKIDNGILKITVQKKEEAKPKKISISF